MRLEISRRLSTTVGGGFALVALLLASAELACFGRDGDTIERSQSYAAGDGTYEFSYATPPWELKKNGFDTARLEISLEFFGIDIGSPVPSHLMLVAKVDPTTELEEIIDIEDVLELAKQNGLDLDEEDIPSSIPDEIESITDSAVTGELPDTLTGGDDPGGTGGESLDETGGELQEIVDYLKNIDVTNPRDVAIAEMNLMIDERNATIITAMRPFHTVSGHSGVEYHLFLPPAGHIRNFYLRTRNDEALRISFVSLYDLDTPDIAKMVDSFVTDAEPEVNTDFGEEESDSESETDADAESETEMGEKN